MEKAVVLLSGGMDSSVVAYQAVKDLGGQGNLIYPLTFLYGQRHIKEVACADNISNILTGRGTKIGYLNFKGIMISSLLGDSDIPTGLSEDIPSTWVPQRNSILLAYAFAYAEMVGASSVYTGLTAVDYSGYPDCRKIFINSIESSLNLGSKIYSETGSPIRIMTPLIDLSKRQIVMLGYELKVPFHMTWSCYQGRQKACGVCDSCKYRRKAFRVLGQEDPLEYEDE